MNRTKCSGSCNTIDRRGLLTQTVPACAVACLGLGKVPGLAGIVPTPVGQEQHRFDVTQDVPLSSRQRVQMMNRGLVPLIQTIRDELGEPELVRLLNLMSAEIGRQVGAGQARRSPDTSFQSFVQVFRPPNFEDSLTHEIVEDTETVFALEVTECVSAEVMQSVGLGGEIGHAAICNMDYYWPSAFNPAFKMERTKTLMQGDSICNHRYINTA